MHALRRTRALTAGVIALLSFPALAAAKPFIDHFSTISTLASAVPVSGPAAGDQNPYGVAVVPTTTGSLVRGDVLVSNFNDSDNLQGTGSSIMEVSPSGAASVFAVVPPPSPTPAVGLTTALVALRNGDVIVGNLPAPGGVIGSDGGALTILSSQGQVIDTISGGDINGPWDMSDVDLGSNVVLFVTNVLGGTVNGAGNNVDAGTVVRIDLEFGPGGAAPLVVSNQVIANGFPEALNAGALVIGPTGVGLGLNGTLYVADSLDNRIAAVPNALFRFRPVQNAGITVSTNSALNDPLGLTIAPGGDIVTANGNDGNVVETTPNGRTSAVKTLVQNGAGDLFGLAVAPFGNGIYFVNDSGTGSAANSLQLLH